MGRKKSPKTEIEAQMALEKSLTSGKTQQELADELGVNKSTISRRIQKALSSEQIQSVVVQSRDRCVEMLGRCDEAYHRILTYNEPNNFGNQLKAATNLYENFGVFQESAKSNLPVAQIRVVVKDREYTIGVDSSS